MLKNKFFYTYVVLVLIDWLTKYYFNYNFDLFQSVKVLGENFFAFTLVHNTGFSFSIGSSYPVFMRVVVGSFATIVSFVLLYFAIKNSRAHRTLPWLNKIIDYGYLLIAAGALGNGFERIVTGYVTDFIDFRFGSFNFAIFNVADIYINIGVAFIILNLLFAKEK